MQFVLFYSVIWLCFGAYSILTFRFPVIAHKIVVNGNGYFIVHVYQHTNSKLKPHLMRSQRVFGLVLPKMDRIQSYWWVIFLSAATAVAMAAAFAVDIFPLQYHENDLLTSSRGTCTKCAMCRLWCISAMTVDLISLPPVHSSYTKKKKHVRKNIDKSLADFFFVSLASFHRFHPMLPSIAIFWLCHTLQATPTKTTTQ